MDVFKTHGAFSWSELITPDPQAALAFYGELFGWQAQTEHIQQPYHLLKLGATTVGGVMGPPVAAPSMPAQWGVYITVDDVERTVAQCLALGGRVYAPVMTIAGVGRMAVLADPQGAAFNVMQYDPA
jgi:uncharacterized protein